MICHVKIDALANARAQTHKRANASAFCVSIMMDPSKRLVTCYMPSRACRTDGEERERAGRGRGAGCVLRPASCVLIRRAPICSSVRVHHLRGGLMCQTRWTTSGRPLVIHERATAQVQAI